jgi:hypothetical protein
VFDARFGLATFQDYPIPPFGDPTLGDQAYRLLVPLTGGDLLTVTNAMNEGLKLLAAKPGSGADDPESQLTALYQAATGLGQTVPGFPGATIPAGQQAQFRSGANKLILLWTDAQFHRPGDAGNPGSINYPGRSFSDVAQAIQALDPPQVLGVGIGANALPDLQNIASMTGSLAPPEGVDCDGDGVIDIQAGQPLVCQVTKKSPTLGKAMSTLIHGGMVNRSADLAITSSTVGLPGRFMLVGQSTNVTVHSVIANRGPITPVSASLSFTATSNVPQISVTPPIVNQVESLGLNEQRTVDQTFTIACVAGGSGVVRVVSAISPQSGTTDLNKTDNTGQITVPVTCGVSWQPRVQYKVGDEVVFNGLEYRARQAHTSQVGWEPPNTFALWERINAGETWAPQVIYPTAAVVSHQGHFYRAIQGHQSQLGWEPPKVPALWERLD